MPENFTQFIADVVKRQAKTNERFGQAFMNELCGVNLTLHNALVMTLDDPFHNDNNLDSALAFVERNWYTQA
jgi:hypothetical protein